METQQTGNGRQGPTTAINLSKDERTISLMGGMALALLGLKQRGLPGLGIALVGSNLILRSMFGHSVVYKMLGINRALVSKTAAVSVPHKQGIRIEESVTINRPRASLFRFWRDFANLPLFMENLKSVTVLDHKRSHWVVEGPANMKAEWDAEIVNEIENEVIAWRSTDSKIVDHAGAVHFNDAPGGRGTEVRVVMEYTPPGGIVGAAVAKLFGKGPKQQVASDLRRFKQLMEAGEIPTTEGQSSGRDSERPVAPDYHEETKPKDVVQQASEESFPASDAPAYY
jgi:uncharacterized membrane protein